MVASVIVVDLSDDMEGDQETLDYLMEGDVSF